MTATLFPTTARPLHIQAEHSEPVHRIDRSQVHKRASAEVLLTRASRRGDEVWEFAIEISRGHSSNRSNGDLVPLIAGLEMTRQLGLAVCHLHGRVPVDWAFTLQQAHFAWTDGPAAFTPFRPFEAVATVTLSEIAHRKGQLTGLTASARIAVDGTDIATGSGTLRCFPRQTYATLRRHAPCSTALARPFEDAVLADVVTDDRAGSLLARLGWPLNDPFHFDHDLDHVPGMLMAEAGIAAHRQLRGGEEPTSLQISCPRFAKLDDQVAIRAEAEAGSCGVRSRLEQRGETVAVVDTLASARIGAVLSLYGRGR